MRVFFMYYQCNLLQLPLWCLYWLVQACIDYPKCHWRCCSSAASIHCQCGFCMSMISCCHTASSDRHIPRHWHSRRLPFRRGRRSSLPVPQLLFLNRMNSHSQRKAGDLQEKKQVIITQTYSTAVSSLDPWSVSVGQTVVVVEQTK